MYDYVIIHGSYGSPFENWFPWLYEELTKRGKAVLVPQMPCGENIQNYENWSKVLDAYEHLMDENTVFIGHSLSPAFIVDYLIKNDMSAKQLVFAAPFYGMIDIPEFDAVNAPFFIENIERAKTIAADKICFISKTDPYVPNSLSIDFANKIGARVEMVDNAGHFNNAAGYAKFTQLLNAIV